MKGFIKWMDNAPFILKIIFSLPGINIIYGIYRIVKGLDKGNMVMLIVGILWIFLGAVAFWLIDLISVIIFKKPVLFA